tara:strand:- start:361 stop:534 length:174 start_codon:yes stop_codon:yes gene_type:complete
MFNVSFLTWCCFLDTLLNKFWFSQLSKITSMGLGAQKGFVANPVLAPPPESKLASYL